MSEHKHTQDGTVRNDQKDKTELELKKQQYPLQFPKMTLRGNKRKNKGKAKEDAAQFTQLNFEFLLPTKKQKSTNSSKAS